MPWGRPIRVVIVDDNPEFLDSATRLLEHQGLSVVGVATTNTEALQHVQRLQPDVTLVDIELGEESGFEVAEKLHRQEGTVAAPVILISTHAEQDFAAMIDTNPAIGFLSKSALSSGAITEMLGRLARSAPR
ncbi:MAG: response regulator transcription factor [Mycobacterium sp.]|nr:response regulator transcription factor [Mycobacterium sp.]